MTLIRQCIIYDVIDNNCNLEAVTVSIKSTDNTYHTICNVYHRLLMTLLSSTTPTTTHLTTLRRTTR